MPAIFIYLLLTKNIWRLLKNKHFYGALLVAIVPIISYYLLRENAVPGYWEAIKTNELGGRYLETLETHKYSNWYYFYNLIDARFSFWYFLVPVGLLVGLFSKNKTIQRWSAFSFLLSISFLLIVSNAQTKLQWYDLPIYPFLSIFVAVFLFYVFEWLNSVEIKSFPLRLNVLPIAFLFLVFLNPYLNLHDRTYLPKEKEGDMNFTAMSHYLKRAYEKSELPTPIIANETYHANLDFYIYLLKQKGVEIDVRNNKSLEENQLIAVSLFENIGYIEEHFEHELISEKDCLRIVQLKSRKNEPRPRKRD
jgi:hypothetical protein